MIYEIKGNLLNADEAFIAHQVNGKGVMGAGVAKQIKNKLFVLNHDGADIDILSLVIWLCSKDWSLKEIKDILLSEGGR